MNILGRNWTRYATHVFEIPQYIWYFLRCLVLFRHPLRVISAYISVSPLPGRVVELRNGMTIHLSEHPHDVITVFLVFVRKDYGSIQPGSTVVDIGANIGVFSLYAAHCGAIRIFAYEPNTEAYHLLLHNVQANHLQQNILPHQLAVTSTDGDKVKFPKKPSMYNTIITDENPAEYELVETVTAQAILTEAKCIDVLKLDCEGAEYDILSSSKPGFLSQIVAIRMEYHADRIDEIDSWLRPHGLIRTRLTRAVGATGSLWYDRQ